MTDRFKKAPGAWVDNGTWMACINSEIYIEFPSNGKIALRSGKMSPEFKWENNTIIDVDSDVGKAIFGLCALAKREKESYNVLESDIEELCEKHFIYVKSYW